MKLLLASIATGIAITAGLFTIVLFVRALFRDQVSVTFALWFFLWPVEFLRVVPGISTNALVWLSLAMGLLLDVVFISVGTYCVLRIIVRRQKRARIPLPPQAPTF
jgi:hypothetical protein